MGPLMKTASIKPEVALLDSKCLHQDMVAGLHLSLPLTFVCLWLLAQDMENMSDDDGWEFVNLGDQQSFGIKTAGLEEKSTACQMLVCCLD